MLTDGFISCLFWLVCVCARSSGLCIDIHLALLHPRVACEGLLWLSDAVPRTFVVGHGWAGLEGGSEALNGVNAHYMYYEGQSSEKGLRYEKCD